MTVSNNTALDSGRESAHSGNNSSKYNLNGKETPLDPNTPQLTEAEKAEIELQTELKERENLDYQAKDLVFSSIIIEGETLEHALYDTVMANLTIDDKHYIANVCLTRERGEC